jgi:hypothetical protein
MKSVKFKNKDMYWEIAADIHSPPAFTALERKLDAIEKPSTICPSRTVRPFFDGWTVFEIAQKTSGGATATALPTWSRASKHARRQPLDARFPGPNERSANDRSAGRSAAVHVQQLLLPPRGRRAGLPQLAGWVGGVRLAYQPPGVTSIRKYCLKSAIAARTASSVTSCARPARHTREASVPSAT